MEFITFQNKKYEVVYKQKKELIDDVSAIKNRERADLVLSKNNILFFARALILVEEIDKKIENIS